MKHTETTTAYVDHKVLDETDHRVGTITDVVYGTSNDHPEDDDTARTPTWLVIDPGVMRASHYVPVEGSYQTEDGDVVVPWTLDWIKSAPKAADDHVVTDQLRDELVQHYGSRADA